jgi:hypothetical protein
LFGVRLCRDEEEGLLMAQGICKCEEPMPSHTRHGGLNICFVCAKPIQPPENRDKMPAEDVQREVARLRRIVNESLDRIQELTKVA